MLLDTGTEEIAHVEMLASCVGMLLSGVSAGEQETAAARDPFVFAQFAGMNPQHAIVSGLGALPADSVGNPWRGDYATASGNVVADLYANATAEMNGRLQACRVYELTDDSGVHDMLRFMIARDHMHQMQWLAAIEELGGPTATLPVPASFPLDHEMQEYAFAFMSYSSDPDTTSGTGRWAKGPSPDGKGNFTYIPQPFAAGQDPHLPLAPRAEWSHMPGMAVNGGTMSGLKSGQASTTTGKSPDDKEGSSPRR